MVKNKAGVASGTIFIQINYCRMIRPTFRFFLPLLVSITFYACNGSGTAEKKEDSSNQVHPATELKKAPVPSAETERPPIINITDTVSVKSLVLTMKDSAATYERISKKLGEIYVIRLGGILKKNHVKITGQPMAWYSTNKAPYFFEAGIPIDKKPQKLPPQAHIREIGSDSVTVAHFYGPYSKLSMGYDAVRDWLKSRKKSGGGKPYEIYISDPIDKDGKPIDPYKVQTDIIFPWK